MRITSFFMHTTLVQNSLSTAHQRANQSGPYWGRWGCISALAVSLIAPLANAATNNRFVDVLDVPARISPLAARSTLFAVAKVAEASTVAVGPRGHILLSTDQGRNWVQSAVPLSSDLVAVQFPDAKHGWAVGHDGVVLASNDAGQSWKRVMDGRSFPALLLADYEKRVAAGETGLEQVIDDVRRMKEEGPIRPFLSVYFRNAQEGWVMGQFNLLLHTADGGRTWKPQMDRTENPDGLSLHAMADVGGALHIVGEAGLVLRLDAASGQFRKVDTPFSASWFGLTGDQRCIVAFGLQGVTARTCDGAASWTRIAVGSNATVNAGAVTQDGRLVLVTQKGSVLVGNLQDGPVEPLPPVPGMRALYGVAQLEPGALVVVGERGPTRMPLPAPSTKP